MEVFILDGFVTENVLIKQSISQCYKHLCKVELDKNRQSLMHTKRLELLEPLQTELNPNTYQVRMMEFGAELSDIYGDLYELEVANPKKSMQKLNLYALKSIENGTVFTCLVYPKDDPADKFEYVQTMLNLELNAGSKLTKLITADPKKRVSNTHKAFLRYT